MLNIIPKLYAPSLYGKGIQRKKEGKDQESIQSSTTPDPEYQSHS